MGYYDLDADFKPKEEDSTRYAAVNEAAKGFLEAIQSNVPDSRKKEQAIQAIHEATMWANSAILTFEPPRMVGNGTLAYLECVS